MRNVDKFRKYLIEDFDQTTELTKVQPDVEEPFEAMNDRKLDAIKDLQDQYLAGEFDNEEAFLVQLAADTGLSFDDYHEFKEFMYKAKRGGVKDATPTDDEFERKTANSF